MPRHLFLLLALFLSHCSQPVEFKRDSPTDPQSDTYSPDKPRNLALSFNTAKLNRLAWQISELSFDSILIERKTTLDDDFVRIASIAKNVTQFVDTTGFMTSPMSYRVASVYRRDGKEFITYSDSVDVEFGAIGKPNVTYNTANYQITTIVASAWKSNFKAEYWVKSHPDSSFRLLSVQPGSASVYTQTVPFKQDVLHMDVAVVYVLGDDTYRMVIDSTVRTVAVHTPASVSIDPMTEASGRLNWTNPFDFHEEILVRINDTEWVLPKSATSLTLPRYFRSGIVYSVSVRYRRGAEFGAETFFSKGFTIQPPTLTYDGPTYPNVTFRTVSTTAANSSYVLGEYVVLEASRDMGPFIPLDSVKITSTSHSFDVAGMLDSLSTYCFRARTLTSAPSAVISIRNKLMYGTRSESLVPMFNRVVRFSPYDDRYQGYNAQDQAGIYDLLSGNQLLTVPEPSDENNGFTKNGHFIARIGVTGTSSVYTTLRRYDGTGSILGEFTIPAYRYHLGHYDDVIYVNTINWNIERYHMPTGTTSVLSTGMPQYEIASYAKDNEHLVVQSGTRVVTFTHSETGNYELKSNRIHGELYREVHAIYLSDNHIQFKDDRSNIHVIEIESGSVMAYPKYPLTHATHLSGFEWIFFNDTYAVIKDIRMTDFTLVYFPAVTVEYRAQAAKIRFSDGNMDMFIFRYSRQQETHSHRLLWLIRRNFWVAE